MAIPLLSAALAGAISTANSTSTNLAGGAAFTGTSEDISAYGSLTVSIFASHTSATNGLSLQQSADGTNWDHVYTFTIPAATAKSFSLVVVAKYFRLVYTNGGTLTTSLRIQTIFSGVDKEVDVPLADGRDNPTSPMYGAGAMLHNGATWDRQRNNHELTTGDTGSKTATFNGATQTNYNARGAIITVLLGTVSGTSPTLNAQLQYSPNAGSTWINYGPASANATASNQVITFIVYPSNTSQTAGATPANLATGANAQVVLNAPLPRTWRVVYTIGGTSPNFAINNTWVSYLN